MPSRHSNHSEYLRDPADGELAEVKPRCTAVGGDQAPPLQHVAKLWAVTRTAGWRPGPCRAFASGQAVRFDVIWTGGANRRHIDVPLPA